MPQVTWHKGGDVVPGPSPRPRATPTLPQGRGGASSSAVDASLSTHDRIPASSSTLRVFRNGYFSRAGGEPAGGGRTTPGGGGITPSPTPVPSNSKGGVQKYRWGAPTSSGAQQPPLEPAARRLLEGIDAGDDIDDDDDDDEGDGDESEPEFVGGEIVFGHSIVDGDTTEASADDLGVDRPPDDDDDDDVQAKRLTRSSRSGGNGATSSTSRGRQLPLEPLRPADEPRVFLKVAGRRTPVTPRPVDTASATTGAVTMSPPIDRSTRFAKRSPPDAAAALRRPMPLLAQRPTVAGTATSANDVLAPLNTIVIDGDDGVLAAPSAVSDDPPPPADPPPPTKCVVGWDESRTVFESASARGLLFHQALRWTSSDGLQVEWNDLRGPQGQQLDFAIDFAGEELLNADGVGSSASCASLAAVALVFSADSPMEGLVREGIQEMMQRANKQHDEEPPPPLHAPLLMAAPQQTPQMSSGGGGGGGGDGGSGSGSFGGDTAVLEPELWASAVRPVTARCKANVDRADVLSQGYRECAGAKRLEALDYSAALDGRRHELAAAVPVGLKHCSDGHHPPPIRCKLAELLMDGIRLAECRAQGIPVVECLLRPDQCKIEPVSPLAILLNKDSALAVEDALGGTEIKDFRDQMSRPWVVENDRHRATWLCVRNKGCVGQMLVCQPLLMVGRRDGLVTQQLIGLTRTRVECLLLGVVTRCSRCCAAADCSCTSLLRYHCDRELRIHLRKACFQVNLSLVRHPDPPAYCMEPSWVNASQVGEQLPNSLAFSGVV